MSINDRCRSFFSDKKRALLAILVIYGVVFHVAYQLFYAKRDKNSEGDGVVMTIGKWMSLIGGAPRSFYVDVHIEDDDVGHAGQVAIGASDFHRLSPSVAAAAAAAAASDNKTIVAIGGGITSASLENVTESNLDKKFVLFATFLPSFCETVTSNGRYVYRFYFAYDHQDRLFANGTFLTAFRTAFLKIISKQCPQDVDVSVHMVQCSHTRKPAWAQNDAMLEAYLDNVDYYYRINDDTIMLTKNWTDRFIKVLKNYNPTKVGVVGPNHSGGNTAILTYDFVHRTHVDIFGFYYPRLFTDWWGDEWITKVYQPSRTTKVDNIYLAHTMGMGRRYEIDRTVGEKLDNQLKNDKTILNRYLDYKHREALLFKSINSKRIISMSLYGKDPKYSWGAIRNAQLVPVFFSGWKLRIYVIDRDTKAAPVSEWLVPTRILNKLKQLGAELAYVKTSIPPVFWRYLVVDDSGVDYFLVRNAHSRLSERDATVVNEWLEHAKKENRTALHCIRDHPKHANLSIVDGLWGGDCAAVRRILDHNMAGLLDTFHSNQINTKYSSSSSSAFLSDVLWPRLSSSSFCHDSVTCENWTINKYLFPIERKNGDEYLGQEFDRHHRLISVDGEKLMNVTLKCRPTKYFKTSVETTTLQNNQSIAQ